VGIVPHFLDEEDPRPAREQFNEKYAHGGGWRPSKGFSLDEKDMVIRYPGDPPLRPVAMWRFRDEMILMYPYALVMVVQPDSSFEIARMD